MQLGVVKNAPVGNAHAVPDVMGRPIATASRSHIRALLADLMYQGGYTVEPFVASSGIEQICIEDVPKPRGLDLGADMIPTTGRLRARALVLAAAGTRG